MTIKNILGVLSCIIRILFKVTFICIFAILFKSLLHNTASGSDDWQYECIHWSCNTTYVLLSACLASSNAFKEIKLLISMALIYVASFTLHLHWMEKQTMLQSQHPPVPYIVGHISKLHCLLQTLSFYLHCTLSLFVTINYRSLTPVERLLSDCIRCSFLSFHDHITYLVHTHTHIHYTYPCPYQWLSLF